jgi:choline dehydrogenase
MHNMDSSSLNYATPFSQNSEGQQRGANDFHGVGGLLSATNPIASNVVSKCLIEAAVALGYPHNPDFNGATQLGVGLP